MDHPDNASPTSLSSNPARWADSSGPYKAFASTPVTDSGWHCWVGTVRAELTCFRLHPSKKRADGCSSKWVANATGLKPEHRVLTEEETRLHLRRRLVMGSDGKRL